MSLWEKFKNLTKPDDFDDDYEDNEENEEEEEQPRERTTRRSVSQSSSSRPSSQSSTASVSSSDTSAVNNKVLNVSTTTQLQVVLVKPSKFEDAAEIADSLKAMRTVVMNLESTNKDTARRLLDFISGVAYANHGQVKRVANNTYIITPYNVGITGNLVDELEKNDLYF